ncbi:hypothetical protein [Ensifer aridi]|uniref:hypothetical protein n=1 Tax=Ensifer aridi TaxID=1708715 RepID=UPI001FCD7BF0|nr:hypothetical protein [Ensifer aridi]
MFQNRFSHWYVLCLTDFKRVFEPGETIHDSPQRKNSVVKLALSHASEPTDGLRVSSGRLRIHHLGLEIEPREGDTVIEKGQDISRLGPCGRVGPRLPPGCWIHPVLSSTFPTRRRDEPAATVWLVATPPRTGETVVLDYGEAIKKHFFNAAVAIYESFVVSVAGELS